MPETITINIPHLFLRVVFLMWAIDGLVMTLQTLPKAVSKEGNLGTWGDLFVRLSMTILFIILLFSRYPVTIGG